MRLARDETRIASTVSTLVAMGSAARLTPTETAGQDWSTASTMIPSERTLIRWSEGARAALEAKNLSAEGFFEERSLPCRFFPLTEERERRVYASMRD
ncbi:MULTISPECIES: hypothetical protein [Bradyrhizobium]|uniref:Uncharacterized protein n=1 Tax=Bradyrhizobium japonicum TaxID=375 RepID=A0A1Y2JTT4_BRAJP|nr:hypothetical protein [Bradyrhizobium japonicum]OSJ35173.1 hypothetical protein BSZ19_09750 [Bradyrhizobium japonicum]